jgi:hypothetical protein
VAQYFYKIVFIYRLLPWDAHKLLREGVWLGVTAGHKSRLQGYYRGGGEGNKSSKISWMASNKRNLKNIKLLVSCNSSKFAIF